MFKEDYLYVLRNLELARKIGDMLVIIRGEDLSNQDRLSNMSGFSGNKTAINNYVGNEHVMSSSLDIIAIIKPDGTLKKLNDGINMDIVASKLLGVSKKDYKIIHDHLYTSFKTKDGIPNTSKTQDAMMKILKFAINNLGVPPYSINKNVRDISEDDLNDPFSTIFRLETLDLKDEIVLDILKEILSIDTISLEDIFKLLTIISLFDKLKSEHNKK